MCISFKFTLGLSSFLILLLHTDCKKSPVEELLEFPSPTFTGSNMLACKVNGKVYVSEGKVRLTADGEPQDIYFSCHTHDNSCYITVFEVVKYRH